MAAIDQLHIFLLAQKLVNLKPNIFQFLVERCSTFSVNVGLSGFLYD